MTADFPPSPDPAAAASSAPRSRSLFGRAARATTSSRSSLRLPSARSFLVAVDAVFCDAAPTTCRRGGAASDASSKHLDRGRRSARSTLAFRMDTCRRVLCLIVTFIGFLIHIYSTGVHGARRATTRASSRYLNLFSGSMLVLVLGDNLPVMFVGWEGVGLCSLPADRLLVRQGRQRDRRPEGVHRQPHRRLRLPARRCSCSSSTTGTLQVLGAHGAATPARRCARTLWLGQPVGVLRRRCFLFIGATGKSAQIPLYVWLPDAMAGPTPVSALIHAATMVTAGVYMVARMHVVFVLAPVALAVVAVVGAATALFAAIIGIRPERPQEGAGLLDGQPARLHVRRRRRTAAPVELPGRHLPPRHARLLQGRPVPRRRLGHARAWPARATSCAWAACKKRMPQTRWTFLVYCLAIAGIFPFAGFCSKDAILGGLIDARWPTSGRRRRFERGCSRRRSGEYCVNLGHWLYPVMLRAAGCTAFYMFRLYFLVFYGRRVARPPTRRQHHIHDVARRTSRRRR